MATTRLSQRGAFIDKIGVRWDTNDPDHEGWMTKKSKWIGEWRRRYFILKGSKLFFCKDPNMPPHGMIDLVDCMYAKSAEIKAKKRNAIEIKLKNETFLVFAHSEQEKDDWITQIGRAVTKHSSLHVREEDESDEEN